MPGSELLVPQHFYAEALAGLRRLSVIDGKLTDSQATIAISRLQDWHLHQVAVAPLLTAAWRHRHNLTAGDTVYVALAEQLGASLLTDDHKLADSPSLPSNVTILRPSVR